MGDPLSIIVILIWTLTMCMIILIDLLPGWIASLINSIGLARICNKLHAFPCVWSWVLSLLFPTVAVLRAGDMAAKRENSSKKALFWQGIVGVVMFAVCILISLLCTAVAIATAVLHWPAVLASVVIIVVIVTCILSMILTVWLFVLLFISHFRIFKAFMPTWGAWLLLAGSVLLSPLSFVVLPVLSFIPFKKLSEEPIEEVE